LEALIPGLPVSIFYVGGASLHLCLPSLGLRPVTS
jgi:hypothetical protein